VHSGLFLKDGAGVELIELGRRHLVQVYTSISIL